MLSLPGHEVTLALKKKCRSSDLISNVLDHGNLPDLKMYSLQESG